MRARGRWKNFIAYSYDELIDAFEDAFCELGYDYEGGPGKPSVLLGSNENSYIYFVRPRKKGDPVTVRIVEAVADPVTKVATYLNGSRKYFSGACLIDISPFDRESKEAMKKALEMIRRNSPKEFWDLSHHPRFRLAVLLRLRIKQNWVQLFG